MPAYNAAKTLEKTVRDIPSGCADEIIAVDDASTDDTVKVANRLGLQVIVHSENRGYGANQKTCYDEALRRGADIIVMIHADYQYDSRLTPYIVGFLKDGICDVILGSRIRTRREALDGGMPLYKYLGNRFLTFTENVILGQNLSDFHTGFRGYTRQILETIPYHLNSDSFVFDTEFLVQASYFGFKIGDIPVPARYFPEASSVDLKNSLIYGVQTLWTLFKYLNHRFGIKKSSLFQARSSKTGSSLPAKFHET